jgi:hypothetical protein
MAHSIDITGIETGNRLKLSDNRRTKVDSSSWKRNIKWKIETDEVTSFRIVGKKSYNPFETDIPTTFEDKVKLKVKKDENVEWNYTIEWKQKGSDTPIPDDPLISIRSSRKNKDNVFLITWIVSLISLFAASLFIWQKKTRNK